MDIEIRRNVMSSCKNMPFHPEFTQFISGQYLCCCSHLLACLSQAQRPPLLPKRCLNLITEVTLKSTLFLQVKMQNIWCLELTVAAQAYPLFPFGHWFGVNSRTTRPKGNSHIICGFHGSFLVGRFHPIFHNFYQADFLDGYTWTCFIYSYHIT